MMRGDIRTLLILENEAPPLAEIARDTGTRLRRRGRDAFTLVFSDGSTAALNLWLFQRPQDHVSRTVLGLAARFRTRAVRGDAERRRNRILLRIQRSKVSLVIGTQGKLSACALRFVDAMAKRTDAIVYDFTSLQRATGEKLVDVHGYVTDDVPTDYPEVMATSRPAPAPVTSWTGSPMVLVWAPEGEALRAIAGSRAPRRVLVESGPHRKELVDRLLDLRERIRRVAVSPDGEDRRNRLSFAVARATALVEASDVPATARRLHGVSFVGTDARDELGRLVLSTSGAQDPRALSPREALVLVRDASPEALRRAARSLSSTGLSVAPLGQRSGAPPRLAAHARELVEVPLDSGAHPRRRQARLEPFVNGTSAGLEVSFPKPMDLDQLGDVLRCARSLDGITFDGWGFFDGRGRALLVRSGAFEREGSRSRVGCANDRPCESTRYLLYEIALALEPPTVVVLLNHCLRGG